MYMYMYMYLTEHNILNPCQSGFRSKHSTNSTLLDVSDHILKNMNDGKAIAAIFLDLKKTFDTVNHRLLIEKLQTYTCTVLKTTHLTGLFLISQIDLKLLVLIPHSDSKCIDIGVPQGSILGPLLFNVYNLC